MVIAKQCLLKLPVRLAAGLVCSLGVPLIAQVSPGVTSGPALDSLSQSKPSVPSALAQPTLSPGVILLMELEGRFAQAVVTGGGKAFASSQGCSIQGDKRDRKTESIDKNWPPFKMRTSLALDNESTRELWRGIRNAGLLTIPAMAVVALGTGVPTEMKE